MAPVNEVPAAGSGHAGSVLERTGQLLAGGDGVAVAAVQEALLLGVQVGQLALDASGLGVVARLEFVDPKVSGDLAVVLVVVLPVRPQLVITFVNGKCVPCSLSVDGPLLSGVGGPVLVLLESQGLVIEGAVQRS